MIRYYTFRLNWKIRKQRNIIILTRFILFILLLFFLEYMLVFLFILVFFEFLIKANSINYLRKRDNQSWSAYIPELLMSFVKFPDIFF